MSCAIPAQSENGGLWSAVGSAAPHRFLLGEEVTRACGKSAVVAALCRRSPKMGNTCLNDTHQKRDPNYAGNSPPSGFGSSHSFVIQRQSGLDHSCFAAYKATLKRVGRLHVYAASSFREASLVGQALPLAFRQAGMPALQRKFTQGR